MQDGTLMKEYKNTIKDKIQGLEEINTLSMLSIEATYNAVELKIEPDVSNIYKDNVQQLISNYVPHEPKTTNVELNILVKSKEPIFHQPRRQPFSENETDQTQVAKYLEEELFL
ncbi:transposon Tf2-6 polyprotein [Nephila pilipes]|uniref:Transposon Tf2-6 polyprotein n=1 Tax=Nephila pilipes TaxID=299642 RepID=A0A8X6Q5B6_NEPPI|nr:transposon Tf2-6 polyprotein [Nephila pilipes]